MTTLDFQRTSSSYRTPRVTRLLLQEFRSYPSLDLSIEGSLIVFVGDNGAGKTNLLEALSLFTPGRGLRRADLEEMAREQGQAIGHPGVTSQIEEYVRPIAPNRGLH